jgi:hypothetical protein
MTERFERAYNTLIDAFFDGTLAKGNCSACAVGNIVAGAHKAKVSMELNDDSDYWYWDVYCSIDNSSWSNLFVTVSEKQYKRNKNDKFIKSSLKLIEPTGYNEDELARIEFAFEIHTKITIGNYQKYSEKEILEDQYNGLCAVFEVMGELDNIEIDYKSKLKEKEGLLV